MKASATKLERERQPSRVTYVADHPLTVEEFCDLFGEDDSVELIDGVAVEQMVAHDPHEDLFRFLFRLLGLYVEERDLGIVRGSRTLVPITTYRGRVPDVLFVRRERAHVVGERGLTGAPDLLVEIVSPGDTQAELRAREADYRQIGVQEVWFVDQPQRSVRGVRRSEATGSYESVTPGEGILRSGVVEGFWLSEAWLWQRPLPKVLDVAKELGIIA